MRPSSPSEDPLGFSLPLPRPDVLSPPRLRSLRWAHNTRRYKHPLADGPGRSGWGKTAYQHFSRAAWKTRPGPVYWLISGNTASQSKAKSRVHPGELPRGTAWRGKARQGSCKSGDYRPLYLYEGRWCVMESDEYREATDELVKEYMSQGPGS